VGPDPHVADRAAPAPADRRRHWLTSLDELAPTRIDDDDARRADIQALFPHRRAMRFPHLRWTKRCGSAWLAAGPAAAIKPVGLERSRS
jgi:hypothetical protein